MNFITKKYKINIPANITVLYCQNKNIITILGPLHQKSLTLKVKLKMLNENKTIFVTNIPVSSLLNNKKKLLKPLQGTTTALIKQLFIESSVITYKKLKFVGIGYKVFDVDNFSNKLLLLKLGFSHPIYFKIIENLNVSCVKQTKLFVFGSSNHLISQTASKIQSFKLPEPYKGKGILKENIKIKLKEGKKT